MKNKTHIVTADWKDTDGLIDEFKKAIKKIGGYVYDHPDFEGSDMYGFIVSNKKLNKLQIKKHCLPDITETSVKVKKIIPIKGIIAYNFYEDGNGMNAKANFG